MNRADDTNRLSSIGPGFEVSPREANRDRNEQKWKPKAVPPRNSQSQGRINRVGIGGPCQAHRECTNKGITTVTFSVSIR